MSARTCLLCGKPLSRIWAGGGDDFCSKEHRNQYRLRRGMDRLQEANKVANLMRRRENPKPISTGLLMSGAANAARAFPRFPISPRPRALSLFAASTRIRSAARIAPVKDRFLPPRPHRIAASGERRSAPGRLRFHPKMSSLAVPRRTLGIRPAVAQARAVRLLRAALAQKADRRDFRILHRKDVRLHLGPNAIRLRPAGGSPGYNGRTGCARILPPGQAGKALRVSGSAGFRLPALRSELTPVAPPSAPGLPRPKRLKTLSASNGAPARRQPITADAGLHIVQTGVATSHLRAAPERRAAAQFVWPGVIGSDVPSVFSGRAPEYREAAITWEGSGARDALDRRHSAGVPTAGFVEPSQLRLFVSRPEALAGEAQGRLSLAPFVPQDSVFLISPFTVQGALGGPTAQPPVKVVEAPPAKFEEHFDAGWDSWTGGTAEWKLDVAGVRTGPLALYSPSLEMQDYELEFLARIENRSVTWVFRAANFEEYYQASISMTPDGAFEFTRLAKTRAGVESLRTSAVPKQAGSKKSFTVRTSVNGTQFAVQVDGQPVDYWADDRFSSGGIGFIGAPDDRARLYWVRLSTAGSPAKEHRTT